MISVLCPTRGRPEALQRSIESIRCLATERVEVLLRFDEDEPAPLLGDEVVSGPRVGYGRMHEMYGDLAVRATGSWLLLWNDDAVMQTQGWDEVIESHGHGLVLNPSTNHGPSLTPFPVVPRWMVQALGHFALNQHCDSWWEEIGRRLGILTPIAVEVIHDRADLTGGNNDATFAERDYDPDFYGTENLAMIDADVATLRRLL